MNQQIKNDINWISEALKRDAEIRQTINDHIADGWDKKLAVNTVLQGSTLGAGYKDQIRHDYGLGLFE